MSKSVTAHGAVRTESVASYILGFGLSLLLTLGAYVIVAGRLLPLEWTLFVVAFLAMVQLVTQLLLFLHVGKEARPRWKLIVFLFMIMVLTIIVAGSLWIMQNLDYHMDQRQDVNIYLHNQDSL